MKPVILRHREWDKIFARIQAEYAATPSIYLMRNKMREQLGFTVREHQHYGQMNVGGDFFDDWRDNRSQICIDFYTESARTMFVLKYL